MEIKTTEELIDEWRQTVDWLEKSRKCKQQWVALEDVKKMVKELKQRVYAYEGAVDKYDTQTIFIHKEIDKTMS